MVISTDNKATPAQNRFTRADNLLNIQLIAANGMRAFAMFNSPGTSWYNFLCVSYYCSYGKADIHNQILHHSPGGLQRKG